MKIMRLVLAAVLWIGLLEATSAATNYVAQGGQTPASPYNSWATAASNIQDAIDVTIAGDTVLVSNGVYEAGGITNYPSGTLLTNRVAIYKAITVQAFSTNPADTLIKGAWDPATNGPAAVRCVWMTNGSTLIGFTLTNGATLATGVTTDKYGGGVYSQSTNTVISNCVITGNSASRQGSGQGGGAYGGTLNNCTLTGNSAGRDGGGAAYGILSYCTIVGNSSVGANGSGGGMGGGTLYNCTIISNYSAFQGGGAYGGTLNNCTLSANSTGYGGGMINSILYNCTIVGNRASVEGGGVYGGTMYNCTIVGNSALSQGGGVWGGTMYNCISWGNNNVDYLGTWSYSCAAGISGAGTITNDPLFITNGSGYGTNHVAGNYRLRNVSPPLNAGTNFPWMTDPADVRSKDLDGLRRIDRFSRQVDMGCYELMLRGTLFIIGQ